MIKINEKMLEKFKNSKFKKHLKKVSKKIGGIILTNNESNFLFNCNN